MNVEPGRFEICRIPKVSSMIGDEDWRWFGKGTAYSFTTALCVRHGFKSGHSPKAPSPENDSVADVACPVTMLY